jgi:hypothetical protein
MKFSSFWQLTYEFLGRKLLSIATELHITECNIFKLEFDVI